MADPYESVSVQDYNANPPADDGSQVAANRVEWATIKDKLADPVKEALESIDGNITDAVAKILGGAGVTSSAIAYQILSTDQGKLVRCTGSGGVTFTTPDATDVDAPFVFVLQNDSSAQLTLDGSGSQTVNGETTRAISPGEGGIVFTDGSNWFLVGVKRSVVVREVGFTMINGALAASVNAGALTVAIKGQDGNDPSSTNPVVVIIRDVTAAGGGYNVITLTAATSLVVSGGSTLDTAANVPFALWIVGFNDGGTFRLGVINCRKQTTHDIYPLGVHKIASSTAEGGAGAADSSHVFYTGTAVSSKAYQILGRMSWESGLGTPGTWSAGPTRISPMQDGMPLPGDIVQRQTLRDGGVATGTTLIPSDNSIPQNTEGDQYMTKQITPRSASNVLRIEHQGAYAHNNAAAIALTVALFQDSVADALASRSGYTVGTSLISALGLVWEMVAGSTSAIDFKLRAGSASSGTLTFNGAAGARLQGGVMASFLTIEEYMT